MLPPPPRAELRPGRRDSPGWREPRAEGPRALGPARDSPQRRVLWLPLDTARSGEALRRRASVCGGAEPPRTRAPGYIRIPLPQKPPCPFAPSQLPSTCILLCPPRRVSRTTAPTGAHRAGDSHSVPVCSASRSPRHARGWGLSPRLQGGCWGGVSALPAAPSLQLRLERYRGASGGGSGASGRESISVSANASPWGRGGGAPRKPLGRRGARPGAGAVPRVLCRRAAPPPSLVPCCDDHGQGHAAQRDGCRAEEPLPGDGLKEERPAR